MHSDSPGSTSISFHLLWIAPDGCAFLGDSFKVELCTRRPPQIVVPGLPTYNQLGVDGAFSSRRPRSTSLSPYDEGVPGQVGVLSAPCRGTTGAPDTNGGALPGKCAVLDGNGCDAGSSGGPASRVTSGSAAVKPGYVCPQHFAMQSRRTPTAPGRRPICRTAGSAAWADRRSGVTGWYTS